MCARRVETRRYYCFAADEVADRCIYKARLQHLERWRQRIPVLLLKHDLSAHLLRLLNLELHLILEVLHAQVLLVELLLLLLQLTL